jgi:hemoglobin
MEGVRDNSSLDDIKDLDDIKKLVDVFYDKVRDDALLAPIFNGIIQDRWANHLNTMYTFWQTVLLGDHTYFGSPFVPHAKLPIDQKHFQAWLKLFNETVDELFIGTIAAEAKWRADKMAIMFEAKIKHYQNSEFRNLL